MKPSVSVIAAACLAAFAGAAQASPIAKGGTLSGVVVAGHDSIYQVFGHPGNSGGDYGPAADAVLTTFAAGPGNVFTFSATGWVSCCSDAPNIPPDGGGAPMSVGGENGLSSLVGNSNIPLVGVFTTDTDPSGSPAPAALTFDANSSSSPSPLLNQVFFIGDGKAGFDNAGGATLTFTAPAGATRLYLGAIDAYGFNGETGFYADNNGQWSVDIHLLGSAPEPQSWAMMILGMAGIGLALRRGAHRASAIA